MLFVRKISAALFSYTMYRILRLCGWKRKTAYTNFKYMGIASGEACKKNYHKLLRNLTHHLGELLFCFDKFKKLPQKTTNYPCNIDGETFDLAPGSADVLEKMRKGGIFLTSHYGNYEAMGPWLCRLGIPLVASYIPIKPVSLNHILEKHIRALDGYSYSVNTHTPRDFLRLIDSGKLFCLLSDQDSRTPSALEGTFMGKPTSNNPLPDFLLKHRPQTPIYFCWIEECGVRTLHAQQIFIPKTLTPLKDCATLIDQFNQWLESNILKDPTLWYGFTHRRFYSKNPKIYQ